MESNNNSQRKFNKGEEWNGTTWKAFIDFRCNNPHLSMYTIDTDCGCGIIKFGEQEIYKMANLTTCLKWDYFEKHKKELLNLISTKEFYEKF